VTQSKAELDRVAAGLNSGAVHLLRSLADVDRLAGLTRSRLSALSVVVFGGPQSLGALAATEGVAGPTMTRIVDGLVGLGLVERRPDAADGRVTTIAATPAGEQLMRTAAERRIEAISAAIRGLPSIDQRRLADAVGLLADVARAIRRAGTVEVNPGTPAS
jgi:DNA-binding MarR family transcriptional regulator